MSEFKMPAVSTGEHIEAIIEGLLALRSNDLEVDGSEVERLDSPCVEVLASAAKLWASDGCSMALNNLSEPFENTLSALGVEKTNLEAGDL